MGVVASQVASPSLASLLASIAVARSSGGPDPARRKKQERVSSEPFADHPKQWDHLARPPHSPLPPFPCAKKPNTPPSPRTPCFALRFVHIVENPCLRRRQDLTYTPRKKPSAWPQPQPTPTSVTGFSPPQDRPLQEKGREVQPPLLGCPLPMPLEWDVERDVTAWRHMRYENKQKGISGHAVKKI